MNSLHYFIPQKSSDSFAMYHLLEHVISKKIQNAIATNPKYIGSIYSAETFLDGISIEIYNINPCIIQSLGDFLLDIQVSQSDSALIQQEADIILREVTDTEMLEEEVAFHKIFELLDCSKINDMNRVDFNFDSFCQFSKIAIESAALVTIIGDTIYKVRSATWGNGDYPHHIEQTDSRFIIGAYVNRADSIYSIFESIIGSYLLGQRDNSTIQMDYMNKHNLYIGYSQYLAFKGFLLVTYLMEHNEELLTDYISPRVPICTHEEVEIMHKELTTYLIYSDPHFSTLAKMFVKLETEEHHLNVNDIPSYISKAICKFVCN